MAKKNLNDFLLKKYFHAFLLNPSFIFELKNKQKEKQKSLNLITFFIHNSIFTVIKWQYLLFFDSIPR